jgi:hypothetical protein
MRRLNPIAVAAAAIPAIAIYFLFIDAHRRIAGKKSNKDVLFPA